MRYLSLIICLLLSFLSYAQREYHISYDSPTTRRINWERSEGKETYYEVDFLNPRQQVVKSMCREKLENCSSKRGYETEERVSYYFYRDTLLAEKIVVYPVAKKCYRTEYRFTADNKLAGWICSSARLRCTPDSMKRLLNQDLVLNDPEKFRRLDFTVESRLEKRYGSKGIVYKCYSERAGKNRSVTPAREHYFKYDATGKLTEHISDPRSAAGGTAHLRQTFAYDEDGRLVARDWYENGRHQASDIFRYTDSVIEVTTKYYLGYEPGESASYTTTKGGYRKHQDGNYYSGNRRFVVCADAD